MKFSEATEFELFLLNDFKCQVFLKICLVLVLHSEIKIQFWELHL